MKGYTVKGSEHLKNQDSYIVLDRGRIHAYVVCDGHGDEGEVVSSNVVQRLPTKILAALLSRAPEAPFSVAASSIVRDAIVDVEEWVRRKVPESSGSGCTAAGVIYDEASKCAHAFTVGDSLVYCTRPDGSKPLSLPLQNASHMPKDVHDAVLDQQWKTGESLVGKIGRTSYMMFPGSPECGLQLYSTIGDFDLKEVNAAVKIRPVSTRLGPLPRGTKFVIASDGYLEGMPSDGWSELVAGDIKAAGNSPQSMVSMAIRRGSTDDVTVVTFETL